MSLIDIASQLFLKNLGGQKKDIDISAISTGLKNLLPTEGGDLDLNKIVSMFITQGGGLAGIAKSWLANGANESISASQIIAILGNGNIGNFASKLGIDPQSAATSLSNTIPELIDKSSNGGSLISGASAGMAKNILGKFF